MTKDELTEAFQQLARGRLDVCADLAEHFMPEPLVVEIPSPTAEDVDAMKAMNTPDKRKSK